MMTLDQIKAIRRERMASDLALYKTCGHLPLRSGGYRALRSVAEAFRAVAMTIKRDCCKITTHRLAVWLVRKHGAPRVLSERREFYLDTRELALIPDLALSRAEIMTALEKLVMIPYRTYVHGETGERRPVYIVERAPQPPGSLYQQGQWGEPWRKPILWRFTTEFRALLSDLHARMRLFQKESKYQGSLKSSSSLSPQSTSLSLEKKREDVRPSYMDSHANAEQILGSRPSQPVDLTLKADIASAALARIGRAFKAINLRAFKANGVGNVQAHLAFTTIQGDAPDPWQDRMLAMRCVNLSTAFERRGLALDDPGLRAVLALAPVNTPVVDHADTRIVQAPFDRDLLQIMIA